MRIDLHVHASNRSACATDDEETQIRAAMAAGLDGLAFTDHFKLVPELRLAELRRAYAPFRIYCGVEITAGKEDWLVLGLHDPRLERKDWDYPTLWRFVRGQGGFMVLAHPFRYASIIHADLALYPPDAIESRSNNTPRQREGEIGALAERYHLIQLTNSDAHSNGMIGAFWNDLPGQVADDRELLETLHRLAVSENQTTPAD
ncbi:MAG TPA: PHP-associated domain-containing protein [Longilinea sp.]|nr:PHP-associated domain-containing protein [Longilinea sp.]